MQHSTKMVMVPQDAYSSLMSQQKQLYSPLVTQLSNLDQELQSILTNPSIDSDGKYHQYMNVFKRYQSLQHQQAHPSQPPFPPPPLVQKPAAADTVEDQPHLQAEFERRIVDGLPRQVRRKGKLLFRHMRDDPQRFNFLKSGELLAEGEVIPGSNITDLIHFATRKRPTARPPPGFEEFRELLHESNVPREAINLPEDIQPLRSPMFAAVDDDEPTFSGAVTRTPRPRGALDKLLTPFKKAVGKMKNAPAHSTRPIRNAKPPEKLGTWVKF